MNLVIRKLKMLDEILASQENLFEENSSITNPINKELKNNIKKILLDVKVI